MHTDTRWVCARTKYRSEFAAEKLLLEAFEDVYLPRFQKKRRHAGKVDTVERPLFPGYLFVLVSRAQRWRDICTTRYVEQVIRTGDQPAIVGEDIIKGLRDRESDGFIEIKTGPSAGDKVRITDGTFANFAGLLEGTDEQRVIVLLNILNRSVRVEMPAANIVAAA